MQLPTSHPGTYKFTVRLRKKTIQKKSCLWVFLCVNLYKENRDPVEINASQSHIEHLQSVAVSLDSGQIRNKIKRTNFLSLQQETLNLKPFIFLSQPTFQL